MNHTAIAKSATAIASGMAERGSRSMPPAVGDGRSPVEGPRGGDATSVSYEPMADIARTLRVRLSVRSALGARVRARAHVLAPRDRARRASGSSRGRSRRWRSPRSCTRRWPGSRTSVSSRARSRCSLTAIVLLGAIGFVGYKIVNDVSDAMSSLQQAAPQRAAELEKNSEFFREIKLKERVTNLVDAIPRAPRGRRGAAGDRVGRDPGRRVPRRLHPHDLLRALRHAVCSTAGSASSTTTPCAAAPSS